MLSFDQLAGEAKYNEVEVLLNADFFGVQVLGFKVKCYTGNIIRY